MNEGFAMSYERTTVRERAKVAERTRLAERKPPTNQ